MHSWLLIGIMALVTALIRFLPFILFKDKVPAFVNYLGESLPYCTMAMLVVFCLKDLPGAPLQEISSTTLSILLVVLIYKKSHSTAWSIVVPTLAYMLMLRVLS